MAEAFQLLEASRARSLLSMLAARDLRFDLDVPPEKERERRSLDADYERAKQQLARLGPGAPAAQAEPLEARLNELRERQRRLDDEIRAASPRLAALREPQPLDAASVAAQLDPGTLLVAYSVGTERTVAFTLSRADGLHGYLIDAGEDDAAPPDRRLAEARAGRAARPAVSRRRPARLFALLAGPMAESLRKARHVIVSADGPLHSLPFAALRDDRGFLAESTALSFVPSGTVYAQQAASRTSRTWGPPSAFADPSYGAGNFAPLPGSRREASTVAAVFPDTRTYLGAQATEKKVKALDRDGRFVHFAVHGLVDVQAPLDSALALSTTGVEPRR